MVSRWHGERNEYTYKSLGTEKTVNTIDCGLVEWVTGGTKIVLTCDENEWG